MSAVFDREGLYIPLSEVAHAEKTESGRLRVHLKGGDIVMIPVTSADDFISMLKAYHDKQAGVDK